MNTPIDLGRKDEYPGCCCPSPTTDSKPRVYYPEFSYSGDEELDLPKRGKMTIEFCVTREVEETDRDGKDRYQCTISVEKILSTEGEKDIRPSKRDMGAEEALDHIAMALGKLKEHGSDEGEDSY